MTQKETTIPSNPIKFLWFIAKPYKWWILLALVGVVIANFAGLSLNYVLKLIVDAASNGLADEGPRTVLLLLFAYPVVTIFEVLSYRAVGLILHYQTAYIRTSAYRVLFQHLSKHSSEYFSDRFAGALAGKVNLVGGNSSGLINSLVWSYFYLIVSVVFGFAFIASTNLTLAYIFIAGVAVITPISYFLAKPQLKLSEEKSATLNKLRGQIVDTITNILTVHQFSRNAHELSRLDSSIDAYQKADIRSDVFGEKVLIVGNLLVMAFVVAILFGAYFLWVNSTITLGDFVLVMTVSTSIIWGISRIGQTLNEFLGTYGETKEALLEVLLPHGIVDTEDAEHLSSNGPIIYDNVTFTYSDATEPVLKDFLLTVPEGQRVGVVGPSGGGKSTLVKLLLRQYDVDRGAILIGGHNISKVTQESLRDMMGIVSQEPALFHRSIKENIGYGKLDATDEEIIEAARKAYLHDFISGLKEGYETLVGERGVKLSGGQRQRVAIARAVLKNAPILVLDEATSALDSESENEIQKALVELVKGKTVIAIAHRLSTIRAMDRIIVLDGGKIVEDGPHDELLKKEGGLYARLWNHQAGGFLQEEGEEEEEKE